MRSAARWSSATANGIATRTARPSAKVAISSQGTGSPASCESAITGAASATTPTRSTSGAASPRAEPTPTSSAPLPTGTITAAGGRGACSRISSPIARYPANWAGSAPSSKNGRSSADANARAASFASSTSTPTKRTSAPRASMRSSLVRLVPPGA
jgi:hypothetical protein